MKNTNVPIKVASALIFLALLSYLALYAAQALEQPFQTVRAATYTVRDSAAVTGIVARDEAVLYSAYTTVHLTAGEGERVAGGAAVARAFDSAEALDRAVRMSALEGEIAQLEQGRLSAASAAEMLRLESDIADSVAALRADVSHRTLAGADARTTALKAQVFTAFHDTADVEARIAACQAELASLGREAVGETAAAVTAPSSGLFSTAVDGWEALSPASLKNVDVAGLQAVLQERHESPPYALGKLVYGTRWTYAALVDRASAERLTLGMKVALRFGRYYNQRLEMRVEFISSYDGDLRAVRFSCDSNMTDVLSMRRQDAELVFAEETGIRVPRKALHVDQDGASCVYVQTGLQIEAKQVTVRYDYGDFYVVTGDKLRAGDAIVVSAKNLYDGKVVD